MIASRPITGFPGLPLLAGGDPSARAGASGAFKDADAHAARPGQRIGANLDNAGRDAPPFLAQLLAQDEARDGAAGLPAAQAFGRYRQTPSFRVVLLGPEVSLDILV